MEGRERVQRAVAFDNPDRVPRDLVILQSTWIERKTEVEDMLARFPLDIELPVFTYGPGYESGTRTQVGTYYDEWGCPFEVKQAGLKGEVKKSPLSDWSALDQLQPPYDFLDQADLSQVNPQCQQTTNFVLAKTKVRPFERLQFLHGTKNVFQDLGLGSTELDSLIKMVHEFNLREIELWAKTEVDAIFFQDDWGSQDRMLISPDMWRERFKPLYADYCSIIKSANKLVFFHSDGHIMPIIPDLIELGVDALNAQLFCMDIEAIGEGFRGEITFWGEIDRQHVLPRGSVGEVKAAVNRLRSALETDRGGTINWCEWGNDVPRENIEAVLQTWI